MKLFNIKQTFLIFSLVYLSCSGEQIRNKPLEGDLDLQGHRGARGLKPENTWPAFEEALSQGMTTLEFDTVLTKDQKIVIHHDSELNPAICIKKDGSEIVPRSIYELTLAELKELDCGTKKNPKFPEQISVPGTELLTIQEFFEKIQTWERTGKRRQIPKFNIETKFPNDAESQVSNEILEAHVNLLIKAIETAKVTDRTTIQSFYLPALSLVKKKNPKIKTSALFSLTYPQGAAMKFGLGNSRRELVLNQTKEVKADIISPYFLYVTDEFVFQAHSSGIKVIPWTVNDAEEMERLIKAGVDGIITDYPDRLNSVLKKH
ncbi:glycerophosphodiester phosphodiesterase [Leptospira sp. WS58.C1]|uniref:glycerophosphodiester phosphodiesterase n=1 Tax=Leptospira TaxID=171 RepID=UPI0002BFEAD3|nr:MULTISPECIES: glycerophosphodiester phosphodiesterase [unclassified Leptospira]EMK01310.1 glycerophosphodiester phosphodiesterase family protein [Leptospira sp. B5-022]MCR1794399.1 glycerophosphodiester phosphodiesterase [Leptospira sp. id769339]